MQVPFVQSSIPLKTYFFFCVSRWSCEECDQRAAQSHRPAGENHHADEAEEGVGRLLLNQPRFWGRPLTGRRRVILNGLDDLLNSLLNLNFIREKKTSVLWSRQLTLMGS